VRQLFNVLRTACVMAAQEHAITCEHLSDDFLDEARKAFAQRKPEPAAPAHMPAPSGPSFSGVAPAPMGEKTDRASSLEEVELDTIQRAVAAAGGNISEASKRLGISRNTIYRKLRWNQNA
jgi:sigma-54 dependent transcriptional regulator, acetoin dehydrogenase operon transcriptional activator AcoR